MRQANALERVGQVNAGGAVGARLILTKVELLLTIGAHIVARALAHERVNAIDARAIVLARHRGALVHIGLA